MNNNNNGMEFKQNMEDLYNYHFEVKETKENILSTSVIKMKGLNPNCTEEQESLANHFKMIRKRYSVQMEYSTTDDFINEYSYLMMEGAMQLGELESLEYLLANPDIYASRMAYIKEHITRGFVYVANPNKEVVKTSKGRKYIDISTESIDIAVGDGMFTSKDFLTEESSIFYQGETTHNHFVQWTIDNKDKLLTRKQNEVFTKLMDIYSPITDRSASTLESRNRMLNEIGMTNQELNQMFRVIKRRVYKKYMEVYKTMKSRTSETNKKIRETMIDYVNKANYRYWNTQEDRQLELTNIIKTHYDNIEEFELTITKGLKLDDKIEIVRGVKGKQLISNRVLRLVRDNISDYLASTNHIEIVPSEHNFKYKENMFDGLSELPTKGGRLKANGTVEYKNENGDWVDFN